MAAKQSGVEPIPPNAEHEYRVSASDLPLRCPMPGMSLWNSHPRVYLPIDETGVEKCPYCGAIYRLEGHPNAELEPTQAQRAPAG